jgi:phosphocarrier protein HPr
MKCTQVTIKWPEGLHMRTAARLVRLVARFRSRVVLRFGPRVADARSILSIMILSASLGSPVDVEASGNDEHEAIQAVAAFFEDGSLSD